MSKNNLIRKSDKKFIRSEKARIRATVLDAKKQQELIDNLYKKFLGQPEGKPQESKSVEIKKEESKKVEAKKTKKAKPKKEKAVKKSQ